MGLCPALENPATLASGYEEVYQHRLDRTDTLFSNSRESCCVLGYVARVPKLGHPLVDGRRRVHRAFIGTPAIRRRSPAQPLRQPVFGDSPKGAPRPKRCSNQPFTVYHFHEEDLLMLKPLCLSLMVLASVALRAQEPKPLVPANPPEAGAAILNTPVPEAPPRLLAGMPASSERTAVPDSDNICYRIRAYLFKRDDDHAPQFVGSTTCGPRQPRARNTLWPEAHLELLK